MSIVRLGWTARCAMLAVLGASLIGVGLAAAVVTSPTRAFAEDAKASGKQISAKKLAARARKKIGDGEPDHVARLLSYPEVLTALDGNPDAARQVAGVVCDNARDIGIKWRGDLKTMAALTDGLKTMAERVLVKHSKSADAHRAVGYAFAAAQRIALVTQTPQDFSQWERAANAASQAAELDADNSAKHLAEAAVYLREGARSGGSSELDILNKALELIEEARRSDKSSAAMQREHAYVHLAIAQWAIRQNNEGKAKTAYTKALELVELSANDDREGKAAYNRIVGFGHQHGLVSRNEGFVGKATNDHWWDLQYPDARGWKFVLAMEAGAVWRLSKLNDDGGRIEMVMRRYDHRRNYGIGKTGGDNAGGLTRDMLSTWRGDLKNVKEEPLDKAGLPPILTKAKGFTLVGEKDGEPTRVKNYVFRAKESASTWSLEIVEIGSWPDKLHSELRYIYSTLVEKEKKR